MVTIDNFTFDTLKRLDELEPNNCLDIRSYKKNRKVIIEKLVNSYNLYEDGFFKETYLDLSKNELKKLLKSIEKKEFPRSNKLRFYILPSKDESVCRANYREEFDKSSEEDTTLALFETSYSSLSFVKKLLSENHINVLNTEFKDIVTLKSSIPNSLFNSFKKIIKDTIDVKLYAI
ncbi:MAG: hypothetical protein ACRDAU_18465 [Clostridium sp.]